MKDLDLLFMAFSACLFVCLNENISPCNTIGFGKCFFVCKYVSNACCIYSTLCVYYHEVNDKRWTNLTRGRVKNAPEAGKIKRENPLIQIVTAWILRARTLHIYEGRTNNTHTKNSGSSVAGDNRINWGNRPRYRHRHRWVFRSFLNVSINAALQICARREFQRVGAATPKAVLVWVSGEQTRVRGPALPVWGAGGLIRTGS